MCKIKLYLDVDGVILTKRNTRAADNLYDFLSFIVGNFDCYWLTTHCKGDNRGLLNYISKFVDSDVLDLLSKVNVTDWMTLKTEAIDCNSSFLWLDDAPLLHEIEYLKRKSLLERLSIVNLNRNNELLNIINLLKTELTIL
ncbi:hypothetical protein MASR1M45_02180 [Candidatus Kapaibacterium sp.]